MSYPSSPMEHLLALAGSAYEAALEPQRWQAFLQQLGAVLRSPVCLIWAHDFQAGAADLQGQVESLGVNMGVDDAALASFNTHYHTTNVWLHNPAMHKAETVVHSSQLFDDARLTQTEWYADWLRPQDLFYSCAAVVEHADARSFNVTAVRSKQLGAYSAQELQLVEQLIPHLKTAFALHRKLHRTQALAASGLAVLDRLPLGVLLLDGQGQFLHANARAQQLLQATQLLRIQGQQVVAALAPDQQWLHKAVGSCAHIARAMAGDVRAALAGGHSAAGSGTGRRMQHWSGAQLQVMAAPLPLAAQPYGLDCGVVLLLSDPARVMTSLLGALQQHYQMTSAEAKLVQGLVNGQSPQEYADSAGLSIHTVRSQFKAAAAKVGVSRQADLVRVVLMGPAMLCWQRTQEAACRA